MRFLKVSALMAVMLASAVMMLGVLSVRGHPARGGSVPGATTNGDVNCDGRVDLSDAIYIIQYSFYGGTPPCALAQDNFATKDELAALTARVATLEDWSKGPGQWTTNQAIPMPGRRSDGRFKDNGDGTVLDTLTGLEWQQQTGNTNGDRLINANDRVELPAAKTYAASLTLGGKSDWRLPTYIELKTIIDQTTYAPAIDPIFLDIMFPNGGVGYWATEEPEIARQVEFYYGSTVINALGWVRAVRIPN
jgi:uncharacterized protein DUF1566